MEVSLKLKSKRRRLKLSKTSKSKMVRENPFTTAKANQNTRITFCHNNCYSECCCSQLEPHNTSLENTKRATRRKMFSTTLRSYQWLKMSNILSTLVMFNSIVFLSIITGTLALSSPSSTHQLHHHQTHHHHLVEAATPSNNTRQAPSNHHHQQQQAHLLASFSTPNQAINITHVTYDPLHDTIYLGATNALYQLNGSDLKEQFSQITGPVFDNPSCGITECIGYEDFMKPTQNVNKILVIDYQHKKLLSCGSTKQGACRRYQLNNIAQKEDLISMAVAANDDNSSTYAFIAPARYYDPSSSSSSIQQSSSSGATMNGVAGGGASSATINGLLQQQVLYVAATYTKSRDLLVPAIGTRTLEEGPNLLKLYENSFVDNARIDISSHLRDYFLVNYLYGFASSNYIYFVTVQKKATSRDYEELGYHTRLARICITDSSYNSYSEVDLKCMPNSKRKSSYGFNNNNNNNQQPLEYPLLQDAILVDAGSHLLQSLAQNDQSSPTSSDFFFNKPASGSGSPDDSKVLLGVFSSAKDHTQHAGEHSALCAFSLSQIEDKFNDNIHNCYTGKMQSRNMEYIAGNVQECPKSGQGGNVVNFCHETLKINGTLPIVSEASIQFHNTTLTAITATSHVNTNSKNIYGDLFVQQNLASYLNSSSFKSTSTSKSFITNPSLSFSSHHQNIATSNQQQQQQQEQHQHTVVFMGTSNGRLKKVLLNNASSAQEFEEIQLDQTNHPIISDIHLHASGQQIIAATPYKVMKVPIHNCAQYTTCKECSQSRNPYCGWCSLKSSCTTKSECNSSGPQQLTNGSGATVVDSSPAATNANQNNNKQQQQLKWISTVDSSPAAKCIDLLSIVPDKIPITSTAKVDLYIDRLPRLSKEHSYKCIFDWKEQTSATQTTFGLSCPLPKLLHRPQIQPGKDHVIVDLAVRSSETNVDSLSGKITFFDCQLHTSCKECLTTNWGCNWCLNENVCLFNTSKCQKNSLSSVTASSNQRPSGENSLVQFIVAPEKVNSPMIRDPLHQQQQQTHHRSSGSSSSTGTYLHGSSIVETTTSMLHRVDRSGRVGVGDTNTLSSLDQCPMFDLSFGASSSSSSLSALASGLAAPGSSGGNGGRAEILIPDGSEKELTVKVRNMPQYKGNIQCLVEIENVKTSLKARIEDDLVTCENLTYTYAAQIGSLTAQLSLIYSDNSHPIDRINLTLYKCHLLAAAVTRSATADCSSCRQIDARFNCVWCSGGCNLRKRCHDRPEEVCPPSPTFSNNNTPTGGYLDQLGRSGMLSNTQQQQNQAAPPSSTSAFPIASINWPAIASNNNNKIPMISTTPEGIGLSSSELGQQATEGITTYEQRYPSSSSSGTNEMMMPFSPTSTNGGADLWTEANGSLAANSNQLGSYMPAGAPPYLTSSGGPINSPTRSSAGTGIWTTVFLAMGLFLLVVSIAAFVIGALGGGGRCSTSEFEAKKQAASFLRARGTRFGSSSGSSSANNCHQPTSGPLPVLLGGGLLDHNLIDTDPIVDCTNTTGQNSANNTGTTETTGQSISIIDLPQSAYLGSYTTQRIYAAGAHLPPMESSGLVVGASNIGAGARWGSRAAQWLRGPGRWLTLALGAATAKSSSSGGAKVGHSNTSSRMHHHHHHHHRIIGNGSTLTNPSSFSTYKSQYQTSSGYGRVNNNNTLHSHHHLNNHLHQQQHVSSGFQQQQQQRHHMTLAPTSSSTSSYVSSSNYYEEIGPGNLSEFTNTNHHHHQQQQQQHQTNSRPNHTIIDPFRGQTVGGTGANSSVSYSIHQDPVNQQQTSVNSNYGSGSYMFASLSAANAFKNSIDQHQQHLPEYHHQAKFIHN